MTARQHAGFWLGAVIVFGLMVWLLRDMLLPFVVAMAVAYLADPVADWLERHRFSRIQATVLITVVFFVVSLLALLVIVPLVANQMLALLSQLPDYLERAAKLLQPLVQDLAGLVRDRAADVDTAVAGEKARDFVAANKDEGLAALKEYSSQAVSFFARLAGDVFRGGVALLNFLALLVITPVVTFYLLLEWDRMVAHINDLLPKRYAGVVRELTGDIDRTLAGFVRGQGAVCLTLMLYYSVLLSASGLGFGFVIGLASGALSFIPFVGAIFGALTSVGLALIQFWPDDMLRVGIVLAIYVAGQLLEAYVLTPKLVGNRIGLHPVWVMFGVLAGGVLFGFVGMLLALPAAAVIGVLVRFGIRQYRESRIYDPANPA